MEGGNKKTTTSMTYSSQGRPIDIDRMWKESKYFWCRKKGHLKHDCLKTKQIREEAIRALNAKYDEDEKKTGSKVKEVKNDTRK